MNYTAIKCSFITRQLRSIRSLSLMELILLLCAFLFSLMVVKIVKKSEAKKLPPGPKTLPIIGNVHQLYGSLPHHRLRDLAKKYGPLMRIQLGEVSILVVSSPEVAKEVFKTHDIVFTERPLNLTNQQFSYDFSGLVFAPYGDFWRQLRKICMMELLSSKRVQTFRSIREEEALNMIRSICSQRGSVVNVSRKIFSLTYAITARSAFGKRSKHQEEFISHIDEIVQLAGGFSISDMYPSVKILAFLSGMRRKLEKLLKEVDTILEHILNEHKERHTQPEARNGEAKEDLVDVLLNIQKSGDFGAPLTDKNVKAVIFDIFAAGSETSSTTVEWAFSEMIRNPEVMEKAQDEVRNIYGEIGNADESSLHELKYLQAVIKETMRLHPPAPLLVPRESTEKCEINGYEIPAKIRTMVNQWAMGRDPAYWNDAEKFNPERFLESEIDYKGNDFRYIPFGAGRRICPGISYALSNIQLSLAQLLFHFDWKLPGDLKQEELDMDEKFGVTMRRKNDLQVIPIPYFRSSVK